MNKTSLFVFLIIAIEKTFCQFYIDTYSIMYEKVLNPAQISNSKVKELEIINQNHFKEIFNFRKDGQLLGYRCFNDNSSLQAEITFKYNRSILSTSKLKSDSLDLDNNLYGRHIYKVIVKEYARKNKRTIITSKDDTQRIIRMDIIGFEEAGDSALLSLSPLVKYVSRVADINSYSESIVFHYITKSNGKKESRSDTTVVSWISNKSKVSKILYKNDIVNYETIFRYEVDQNIPSTILFNSNDIYSPFLSINITKRWPGVVK